MGFCLRTLPVRATNSDIAKAGNLYPGISPHRVTSLKALKGNHTHTQLTEKPNGITIYTKANIQPGDSEKSFKAWETPIFLSALTFGQTLYLGIINTPEPIALDIVFSLSPIDDYLVNDFMSHL